MIVPTLFHKKIKCASTLYYLQAIEVRDFSNLYFKLGGVTTVVLNMPSSNVFVIYLAVFDLHKLNFIVVIWTPIAFSSQQ